ncbi:MAG: site-specific DNA-methyltransferase [Cellulomonadaceae bacterium]|jgi:adenine-specific DNA-methyltransferase|nr:site-specific DNA-methyltransferase [Cellulomonadaceae bacterium]
MAHIDNLIASIKDDRLRDALRAEYDRVTKYRRVGLVFDRHLPETIALPDFEVRAGEKVLIMDETPEGVRPDPTHFDGSGVWTVKEIGSDGAVMLLDNDGDAREVERDRLVATREFGDSIYPGLRSTGRIERGGDKPFHTVINAENYHALETLQFTHREAIDVIYIDPPYNTGGDFAYNDNYVDGTDPYRHSKWLSFMEKRLILARDLLKPTGVIIVAIDDNEHARLRLLLDEVFGADNFLANITWQGSGKNNARFTAGGTDYMLIYSRNQNRLIDADIQWKEPKPGLDLAVEAARTAWTQSNRDPVEATRLYRAALRKLKDTLEPAVFRYDQIDNEGRVFQADNMAQPSPRPNLQYDVLHPTTGLPVKMHPNGWRVTPDRMAEMVADGRVLFGPDESTAPRQKRYLTEQSFQVPYPTLRQPRMPASKRLEDTFGESRFLYPKDETVLARWIDVVTSRSQHAVVLDFFAGSGSTAHAVMSLNAADGGRRQSIIVTNNEVDQATAKRLLKDGLRPGDADWEAHGIYRRVTRPRVETIVTGVREDGSDYSQGFAENVEFFDLTYEDPGLISLGMNFAAVAPLLWLKAGATGACIDEIDDGQGWSLPPEAAYGIVFDTANWSAFVWASAQRDDLRHIFVVTDSLVEYQSIVAALDPSIPTTRLYADYLRTFEINTTNI